MNWINLKSRTTVLVAGLTLMIALSVVSIISGRSEISMLQSLQQGAEVSQEKAESIDDLVATVAALGFLAYLVTVPAFMAWFYAAHRNLKAAGLAVRHSSAWTVAGFLIPIISLYKPYQVMKDVWRGSRFLGADTEDDDWEESADLGSEAAVAPLVRSWWALFLLMNFVDLRVMRVMLQAESISDLLFATYADLFSHGLTILSAFVALRLVRKISTLQSTWRERTGEDPISQELARDLLPV